MYQHLGDSIKEYSQILSQEGHYSYRSHIHVSGSLTVIPAFSRAEVVMRSRYPSHEFISGALTPMGAESVHNDTAVPISSAGRPTTLRFRHLLCRTSLSTFHVFSLRP